MYLTISCFFHILCTFYICKKLLTQEIYKKSTLISYSIHVIILYIFSLIIQSYFKPFFSIIFILLTAICLRNLYKLKGSLAFILSLISYSLYYVVHLICLIPPSFLGSIYYYRYNSFPYILAALITGVLAILFIYLLFNSKRANYNISFIRRKNFMRISILLSILIQAFKLVDYSFSYKNLFKLGISRSIFFHLATILLALLLFTWWRKQITKSYIEKLRKLEVQSLYDELEEKERLIKKLTADNQSLSRIIHKDNKLIPAMEHAVTDFLSGSQDGNPESLRQYGMELTEKLREMAQDRQGILDSYESESHKLKLTGHVSLDAMLVYMQKKALTNHITFECKHSPETIDYLLSKISEEDLTHILSDLAENALIAMNKQQNGRLQITFGKLEKEAYISIADTGIPFDLATLHSFGLQPHTTHEDSGGSGIGLMDIWNIKKKYRATIQIQEYAPENASFTKRILFSFNAKNHYVIQSFRHAEISNTQTRGDLYVIPSDTKESNEDKQHERINQNLNS